MEPKHFFVGGGGGVQFNKRLTTCYFKINYRMAYIVKFLGKYEFQISLDLT